MTLIKSISGIRGTIGGPATENLTPLDIVKFTTAYVRFIAESAPGKRLKIVVGRDARISGEMVGDIIEGTLLGCGADVVNIGLCTTPGTELAVTAHRADGGIIITASHNPRQWNALKLLNAEGEFLSDAEGKRVLALAEDESFVFPDVDHIGKVVSRESYNDEHIRRVLALPLVDAEAVRRRRFKVVVDAVNSVGGIVIPKLLRELGCEVVELNCEPTGEFAHNPEPLPEPDRNIEGDRPRTGRSGRSGRSRCGPAGLRQRRRLDVCRRIHIGRRGGLYPLPQNRQYGVESELFESFKRCNANTRRRIFCIGGRRSQCSR